MEVKLMGSKIGSVMINIMCQMARPWYPGILSNTFGYRWEGIFK